jgi:hypothetical protein
MANNCRKLTALFISLMCVFFMSYQASADKVEIKGMPKNPHIIMATYFGESLSGLRYVAKEFKYHINNLR